MKRGLIVLLIFVALMVVGSTAAQGTTAQPTDSGNTGLLTAIFGENLGDIALNGVLALLIYKTAPALLGLIKSATMANQNVSQGVIKLLDDTLKGMQSVVSKNTETMDNVLDYIKQRDQVVDARLAVIEQKQEVMLALLEDMKGKPKN